MEKYKLRIYITNGADKGNLDHEEFFETLEGLQERYDSLFRRELYSCNPTAWERKGNEWNRLAGY